MKILHNLLLLAWLPLCAVVGLAQQSAQPAGEVYIVPFSHLDLYWAGTQEECLSRGSRIAARAMQLAKEHPEFRFLLEDEVFVASYMDSHKGMPEEEELRSLVKKGQIEINPKWAAIYQNLPRGEALVRNLVYGKRYAREVFGVDPLVAELNDIPGFTRQYPQMLSKSSIPYMVMTRMGPPESPLFYWKAPDGSSTLIWSTLNGYSWGANLGLHHELDDAHVARIRTQLDAVQALTRGPVYLGWGTDLFAPNEGLVSNLEFLNRRLAPSHFRFASPTEYFQAAAKTPGIPTISGEIPSSWANIITSMTPYWPSAMTAADMLTTAEKFAAINDALGLATYPQAEFDHLWPKALESMDHNNFGQGGDIGDARKVGYAQAAILQGGQILRESLRNIAERVQHRNTRGTAIVVFNPLSWIRDDVVSAHVSMYGDVAPGDIGDYRKSMRLVDAEGTSIPFDVEGYAEVLSRGVNLVFVAPKVPSLGYKTFYLEPAPAEPKVKAAQIAMDDDLDKKNPRRVMGNDTLENAFYRVTVDRATGLIEVFDKDLGHDVAKNLAIAGVEERGGNALNIIPETGRTFINNVHNVQLVRNGSEEVVLRIDEDVAGVPITQSLTLYRDKKRIDLENRIDWTPGHFMKLEQLFPIDMANAEIRNGVPFGSAADVDIMPHSGPWQIDEVSHATWQSWRQIQDWIAASNADWNLTISADHQMFTVDNTMIRGDMIRGTRFNTAQYVQDGREVLAQLPPANTYIYRYSITSGKGNWAAARSWRTGMAFNLPLIAVASEDEISSKPYPPEQSFLTMTGDTLALTALKKSDKGTGIIARFYEAAGTLTETTIQFLGKPHTLRVTNMLEELEPGTEKQSLKVKPYEIDTVELQYGKK
jgi:alpha-mannosidase